MCTVREKAALTLHLLYDNFQHKKPAMKKVIAIILERFADWEVCFACTGFAAFCEGLLCPLRIR